MLVCELIFKYSDFTGIMRKKSTKNMECYFLLIIIFKNFEENIHFLFLYVN